MLGSWSFGIGGAGLVDRALGSLLRFSVKGFRVVALS